MSVINVLASLSVFSSTQLGPGEYQELDASLNKSRVGISISDWDV